MYSSPYTGRRQAGTYKHKTEMVAGNYHRPVCLALCFLYCLSSSSSWLHHLRAAPWHLLTHRSRSSANHSRALKVKFSGSCATSSRAHQPALMSHSRSTSISERRLPEHVTQWLRPSADGYSPQMATAFDAIDPLVWSLTRSSET
jgi:hypothetical protein